MTFIDVWDWLTQYGILSACLGVATYALFTGKVVNGDVARRARESAIDELKTAHKSQIDILTQRFEEMQSTWRDRFQEVSRDRDYYRTMAFSLAGQLEQSISVNEVATGVVSSRFARDPRAG